MSLLEPIVPALLSVRRIPNADPAARRERIDPANLAGVQGRLAMRPVAAFLAQINQFQDQFSRAWDGGSPPDVIGLGFLELPPAGYLPLELRRPDDPEPEPPRPRPRRHRPEAP